MRVISEIQLLSGLVFVLSGCTQSVEETATYNEEKAGSKEHLELALPSDFLDGAGVAQNGVIKDDFGEKQFNETKTKVDNTLLTDWIGPYQGVPAFDKVKMADAKDALQIVMKRQSQELNAIASNPQKPNFENTIVAMEKTGEDLNRVLAYWGVWRTNVSSPEFRVIDQEMAPKLSDFYANISQNGQLFARVKAVYESEEMHRLRPDQKRLVQITYDYFARNGVTLQGEEKERYAEVNRKLAELQTHFTHNVLHDEEKYVLYLTSDQIGGLPNWFVNGAAAAAESRAQKGKYAITNTRSSVDPFLTYSNERSLREKVWKSYYNRGDNGDKYDNNRLVAEILKLRHERAQLLGYDNYAQWRLENRMAKTPENALALLKSIWPAASSRVREQVAVMQSIADAEDDDIEIAPWDYRYYAEKVRQSKYALNSKDVSQYLQLDKLSEAMFYVAARLFNFTFTPVDAKSVPVFHEDVQVWEVTNSATGRHIGLWYLDPYARKGKRSGAWAVDYRSHASLNGEIIPLVSNNANFIKPASGDAELISWDDAKTFFHEFGHALHSLSSNVVYPSLNEAVRDYVEFQSQLIERWLFTDEIINRFLIHHKTGKPMPAELVNKIRKVENFNKGFETTEYLAAAMVDLMLHVADPDELDTRQFEQDVMRSLNMPKELVMRHRIPHFTHIFSGEGYSAGYYGYIWSEVLAADAAEAFAEAKGGFFDQELAKKLVENLFAVQNAIDPAEAYREFRGRDPKVDAIMRERGFTANL